MTSTFVELYRYRALIAALVNRQLSSRYRGSLLGFLWSFLNPLCLMLVYVLVFRYYIRFTEVPDYTVYLFAGLLPWIWFTSSLSEGTSSIVQSGHLITKSMFPAHILPAVSVLTNLVNFVLSLPILFIIMAWTGVVVPATILLIPVVIILQALFLYGVTLALSALNVQFRDVQHLVINAITFLFFLCPIVYPAHVVPERFRFTLDYNPAALFIVSYHNLILDGRIPDVSTVVGLVVSVLLSVSVGIVIHRRYRESFAELL